MCSLRMEAIIAFGKYQRMNNTTIAEVAALAATTVVIQAMED